MFCFLLACIPPNICSRFHPFLYLLGQVAIPDTNEPKHYICGYLGCAPPCDGTFQQKQYIPTTTMMQWKFCHYARQGQWCEPCLKRAVLSCKDFFLLQLCDRWLKCGANTLLEAPVCSWISQPFSDHIHPAICSQMRERNKDLLLSPEITNFLAHRREDFIYQSFPGLSDKYPGVGTTECCAPEGLHSSGSMSQWSLSLGTIVP